ncbi:MAG: tRNA pseudouridine(38-40) synthase TruA [Holosporales bacterium]|jgi:tRNA pseudouridine38-40 synthase|nr:tRNA pseudouridine(38-40) synthase TruA [Holosporales bacterium]
MSRYKVVVEYDGSFFCGWQRQRSDFIQEADDVNPPDSANAGAKPSVQGTIERAIFKLTGRRALVEGAGRTDAGVHALGQVAHFDWDTPIEPYRLLDGLNFYVRPYGCSVLSAEPVSADFHARFSATSREYIYKIVNRHAPLALEKARAWHVPRRLDVASIKQAAESFLGTHNFNAFRAAACQSNNPVKTLDILDIYQRQECIEIHAKAKSFLHNQVRIMVGTLIWVGLGKYSASIITELLKNGGRVKSGPTAPPHGLYLSAVNYTPAHKNNLNLDHDKKS